MSLICFILMAPGLMEEILLLAEQNRQRQHQDHQLRQHRRQFQAGLGAADHVVSLFVIEKQIAVERVHQGGGAKGAGDLGKNIEGQFALFKIGKDAQGDTDRRVEVSPGNTGTQVDRHAHAVPPDDTDFP